MVLSFLTKLNTLNQRWSTTSKKVCTWTSIHGKACPDGFQRLQKEPSSEALPMLSQQIYYNGLHLYLLQPSWKWVLELYMKYRPFFFVQCRDIKVLWHTTVLKYGSTRKSTREPQGRACTLENAWCFCKTRRANNSLSSNGSPGVRKTALTRFQRYLPLNWSQRQIRSHTAPCLSRPFLMGHLWCQVEVVSGYY